MYNFLQIMCVMAFYVVAKAHPLCVQSLSSLTNSGWEIEVIGEGIILANIRALVHHSWYDWMRLFFVMLNVQCFELSNISNIVHHVFISPWAMNFGCLINQTFTLYLQHASLRE